MSPTDKFGMIGLTDPISTLVLVCDSYRPQLLSKTTSDKKTDFLQKFAYPFNSDGLLSENFVGDPNGVPLLSVQFNNVLKSSLFWMR